MHRDAPAWSGASARILPVVHMFPNGAFDAILQVLCRPFIGIPQNPKSGFYSFLLGKDPSIPLFDDPSYLCSIHAHRFLVARLR